MSGHSKKPLQPELHTLERILVNALEHFSKYGYLGASVREITAAANVTKPTLYYYFKNKEELFKGLAESCIKRLMGSLEESIRLPGPLADRFIRLCEQYNKFCDDDEVTARFLLLVTAAPTRDIPDVGLAALRSQWAGLTQRLVSDAHAAGEIGADQVDCAKLLLASFFVYSVMRRIGAGEVVNMNHVRQSITALIEG